MAAPARQRDDLSVLDDPAVARAVAISVFAGLERPVLADLLAGHRPAVVVPGEPYPPVDMSEDFRPALVVSGLVRLQLVGPDGRGVVGRYCGPGAFIGAAYVHPRRPPLPVPAVAEAIVTSRVLHVELRRLRRLATTEVSVAYALIQQLIDYQTDMVRAFAGAAFGTIRERTALHLLDSCVLRPDHTQVAPVTQQMLADAVGTTREAVGRALGELRRAGVVMTVPGGYRVLDAGRLAAEAHWLDEA